MSSTLSKILAGLGLVVITSGSVILSNSFKISAAGFTPTISPSSQTISTSANITLSFTPTTPVTNGSSISVSVASGYTGGAALTNADIAVSGVNITSATSSGFSLTGFTSTLVTSAPVTTPITIVIGGVNKLTTPAVVANYAFVVSTSVGDTGSNLQYIGNANVVNVSATIPVAVGLSIRTAADNANTQFCLMGNLNIASIGSCSYRIKVNSNATSYAVFVSTSGNFTNGSYSFANATTGSTGTNLVPGNEKYGVTITPGSATSGTVALNSTYDAGSNAVSFVNTSPTTLLTVTGQNNPLATDLINTSLITHRATISSTTPAGLSAYTQSVNYTILPTF